MTVLAPRRRATTLAAIAVAVVVLPVTMLLTLSPTPVERAAPWLVSWIVHGLHDGLGLSWFTFARTEVVSNVLLGLPIGALAYLILPRRLWPASLLVAPVLSIAIELVQALLPDRTPSAWDVVANASGGALGVAIAGCLTLLVARRSSASGTVE